MRIFGVLTLKIYKRNGLVQNRNMTNSAENIIRTINRIRIIITDKPKGILKGKVLYFMDSNEKKVVRILNIKQASYYIKNKVKPIDIIYTDKLVFVFRKSDTTEVWKNWCNYDVDL